MDYQTLKQQRDDLLTQIHDCQAHERVGMYYDNLMCFIDEYEELTRRMLQYIKKLESDDLLSKETPVVRDKEWENTADMDINDQEDRKWLEHYLSLGE